MRRTLLAALLTGLISAPGFAVAADSDHEASRSERMQRFAADRQTMLDAKLAGMKSGLGLTADQGQLWAPFEAAVKDAAKSRMEAMSRMAQSRADGERMSPIDHLDAMADRLSQGGANVRK